MPAPAHTPTPWNFWSDDDNACIRIVGAGSHPIVVAKTIGNESDDLANAAHIVRCVNSHDALVAVVEASRRLYAAAWAYEDSTGDDTPEDVAQKAYNEFCDATDAYDAALATLNA